MEIEPSCSNLILNILNLIEIFVLNSINIKEKEKEEEEAFQKNE